MRREMNSDVLVNRLIESGVVFRISRGKYTLNAIFQGLTPFIIIDRKWIHENLAEEVGPGRYCFKEIVINFLLGLPLDRTTERPTRPLRTITRLQYRSADRNVASALRRLNADPDGVKRSYGIEYEIYSLDRDQESKLAYLLDTLPPHVTERDGSLSSSGVEIIFEPLCKEDAIKVVNTLREFVVENDVPMNGTGMHITFGVSNANVSILDLVIRLNRLALAVKSVGLQTSIINLFGRDFTSYARLPEGLKDTTRYRAFNVRNSSAWECRLVNYNCNIEKIIDFFSIAEPLFHRPFEAQDFMKVFELLGGNTDGQ